MKNLKYIAILVVGFLFFSTQNIYSQSREISTVEVSINKNDYKKIAKSAVPAKVKSAVSKIAHFTIKDVAVDTRKSGVDSVYLVTMVKGKSAQQYLVNADGKILQMLE